MNDNYSESQSNLDLYKRFDDNPFLPQKQRNILCSDLLYYFLLIIPERSNHLLE